MSHIPNGTAQRWLDEANTAATVIIPAAKVNTRKPRRQAKTPRTTKPRTGRQALGVAGFLRWTAVAGPCGLAVLLLGVSMPHLSQGFQHTTSCGALAGWLLAVAIDAAQLICKLQLTLAAHHGHKVTDHANGVALGVVLATGLLSCAMNVMAFVGGAATPAGKVLGGLVGVMFPLLILALSYTASCFALRK